MPDLTPAISHPTFGLHVHGDILEGKSPWVIPNVNALLVMDCFVLYRSTAPGIEDKPVNHIERAWSDVASCCGPAVGLGGKLGAIETIDLRPRINVRGKG